MAQFDTTLRDDFITNYTSVTLVNTYNYYTSFRLGSVTLLMNVRYNPRNKRREISLETIDGEVLLTNTFVSYNRRCELNNNAVFNGLNYYVILKPIVETKTFSDDFDYINWADDFVLCFVGYDQSLVERMNVNLRVQLVGN